MLPVLDKSKFRRKVFQDDLINVKRTKPVAPIRDDQTHKLVLLRHKSLDPLSREKRKFIEENNVKVNKSCDVVVGYEQMTSTEVLKMILPDTVEVVRAFEQVGHIVHLNLDESHEKYENIITKVLMDKNPTVKTIVKKVGIIENKFRVLPFKLIAGKADYLVEIREHGNRFQFDFSKVYWNSRLCHEHQRIVKFVKSPQQVVFDMFAGVGPFVIPIAKTVKCKCYANDLNPYSFQALVKNVQLNKLEKNIQCFNMDGNDFIKSLIKMKVYPDHVIMNLPGSAIEFLPVFKRLYPLEDEEMKIIKPVTIHCYTFLNVKEETNPKRTLKLKVMEMLGCSNIDLVEFVDVHDVRDVSSYKKMYCVSFRPKMEILARRKRKLEVDDDTEQIESKKQKS